MRSNDITNRADVRAKMQQAIKEDNAEAFQSAFDEMLDCIATDIRAENKQDVENIQQELDGRILAARGVRQLTSEEHNYYQKLGEAMRAKDPKQALSNLNVVMPETVIDSVFDELQTAHPLLSKINFIPTGGAVKLIMNTNGYQEAAWGELCDTIVKELTSGFKAVNTTLLKLSAFLPVCKEMLELGPEWLDNYVRQVLYEALSNGMEAGIVDGDGNEQPIGMTRQVGDNVVVTGGVYPRKDAIQVNKFDMQTVGNLLSLLAVDPNGKARQVRDIILLVNPADYYVKVMPATTIMAPDGSYRSTIPYPMDVIQSPAVKQGEAIIGMAYRYFAAAGTSPEGNIDYSDHYQFLEDKRVYLIKALMTGMPMDNSAFLRLDISGLTAPVFKFENVTSVKSTDANLSSLTLGAATLSPAFAAATTTYTATTTNANNTINAVPENASATIEITLTNTTNADGVVVANGSSITWDAGANTVKVKVTAEDGNTTKTYTVTVTKS